MRTTAEVIEAARLGDPCTEEELRMCIASMRFTAITTHKSHMRWACDESLPPHVQLIAKRHWESVNDGWHVPLDIRVGPEDRPGHPNLKHRRDVANAVYNQAKVNAGSKGEPTDGVG